MNLFNFKTADEKNAESDGILGLSFGGGFPINNADNYTTVTTVDQLLEESEKIDNTKKYYVCLWNNLNELNTLEAFGPGYLEDKLLCFSTAKSFVMAVPYSVQTNWLLLYSKIRRYTHVVFHQTHDRRALLESYKYFGGRFHSTFEKMCDELNNAKDEYLMRSIKVLSV